MADPAIITSTVGEGGCSAGFQKAGRKALTVRATRTSPPASQSGAECLLSKEIPISTFRHLPNHHSRQSARFRSISLAIDVSRRRDCARSIATVSARRPWLLSISNPCFAHHSRTASITSSISWSDKEIRDCNICCSSVRRQEHVTTPERSLPFALGPISVVYSQSRGKTGFISGPLA